MNSCNQSPKSSSISQRVFVLSQKINHYNSPKNPVETMKKCDRLQSVCDDLENQLEQYKCDMSQQLFDLTGLMSKIQGEINHDYKETDAIVRQQIDITTQKVIQTIQQQNQSRKISDGKLMRFIEQEITALREILQKQTNSRQREGESINQSLQSDLTQIKDQFQQTNLFHKNIIVSMEKHFYSKCQDLQSKLAINREKYAQSEAEFYTMMRDLIKKVKQEIQEHQNKRQETEQHILALIENMCDKIIQGEKQ